MKIIRKPNNPKMIKRKKLNQLVIIMHLSLEMRMRRVMIVMKRIRKYMVTQAVMMKKNKRIMVIIRKRKK